MPDTELQTAEPSLPFKPDAAPTPEGVLGTIANLAANPKHKPDDMLKLLEMYERLALVEAKRLEIESERAYKNDLAALQERLPQIDSHGTIPRKAGPPSKYAKLEDIDQIIKPMLAEYGFAFQFNNPSREGEWFRITGTLSHRDGYSKDFSLEFPLDRGPGRNDIQSVGSTLSYARRHLIKLMLNIVEKGEDDDGAGGPITEEQARDLETAVTEVKGDPARFLKTLGVSKFEEIPLSKYGNALLLIANKRQEMEKRVAK